jgi:hypothetical protein
MAKKVKTLQKNSLTIFQTGLNPLVRSFNAAPALLSDV